MENVRHHVISSGNSSLRGFFSSDLVDFDPPSPSLRQNIMKAKAKIIYDLADGATGDDEENEIRDRMTQSENSYELIRMVAAIDGWEGLDNELPEGHLDDIARQLAQVLDQHDYVVYQLIRRYLVLLDYNASPNLGDCFAQLLQWPVQFQHAEFDFILNRKGALLKGIASATMRERTNMVKAASMSIEGEATGVIEQYYNMVSSYSKADELIRLMHEVRYTTRICGSLVDLHYRPLYGVIAEMVDPSKTNLERIACRDTCKRLSVEFSAAAKAVDVVGSNEARTTIDRFMLTLNTAINNFPPTLPAPTAVAAIIAALDEVGNTFTDLLTAITDLPDALDAITIPNLLGRDEDNIARELIGQLASEDWLARSSFEVKLTCLNSLLHSTDFISATTSDEEIAINKVMRAAKEYERAELYQLVAAASWESLSSNVDGDEYDELEDILNQP